MRLRIHSEAGYGFHVKLTRMGNPAPTRILLANGGSDPSIDINCSLAYPTHRPQAISHWLMLQSLPPQAREIEPAEAGFVRLAAPF